MSARSRESGENGYKISLTGLDDVNLENQRDGAFIKLNQTPFRVSPGNLISVSTNVPTSDDGEDGDFWFVIT